MFFAADLCRHLVGDLFIDSIAVSSYHDNSSTGKLDFRGKAKLPMTGRHVLLVDGVLDTGLTLLTVAAWAKEQGALSVRTCVLAEKDRKRSKAIAHADWAVFQLPDKYLVGYGMDDNELYRQLPYIAVIGD
jgi:hypoxanthine phosphoribosyltransferase